VGFFRQLISVLRINYDEFFYSGSPLYFFHHIPKSGGTSVRNALSNWFNIIPDYRPSVEETPETLKYLNNRLKLDKYNSKHCIFGHFELPGNYLHERYPEVFDDPDKYKIFTIFRDPLDLAISLYYFQIKTNIKNRGESLEEFLKRINNYTARRLPCDMNNFKHILQRYFYIGINEHMQESLDKLARILKKPKIKIPNLNRTQKDQQVLNISPDTIRIFRQNNVVDYHIYEFALKKFKEL